MLVKLQTWIVAAKQKVVILFEGRDAAGITLIKYWFSITDDEQQGYIRHPIASELMVPEVYRRSCSRATRVTRNRAPAARG